MLATLIIVFREMLEAALIIGIVSAATRGVKNHGRWISAGIAVGISGALVVAGLAGLIMEWADGMGQELFNACVLFAAVLMLAWHNIWMSSHAKELILQMEKIGATVTTNSQPVYVLLLVIAMAVLREGSEVVLFLYGLFVGGTSLREMILGGAAGIVLGMTVGFSLYFGLLKIPTRLLFSVTGWMILFLAAGLSSQGASFLIQADMLPAWGYGIWDSSHILTNNSALGSVLHTLIGYDASPAGMQVAFYIITLLLILTGMRVVQNEKQNEEK